MHLQLKVKMLRSGCDFACLTVSSSTLLKGYLQFILHLVMKDIRKCIFQFNFVHCCRTKSLVLELLAAVCLVRGGHDIILRAFDNFKQICGESRRFTRLMVYFQTESENIDFMVSEKYCILLI